MPVNKENLISSVHTLSSDIGARSFLDVEGLGRAAGFIEDAFSSYGLRPTRQAFEFEGRTYHNVCAEVGGGSAEVLVIGAHYDTVAGSPGADDNASGVAGLLELARLASSSPHPVTVRFAAFCLEEPPAFRTSCMGSEVYALALKDEGVQVVGMISLEMIGYFCDVAGCQFYPLPILKLRYPRVGSFIALVGNKPSKGFTHLIKKGFKESTSLPVESLNTFTAVPGVDFSDHRSFWKHGFDAFMVTDTAFYRNPHYHTPGDTPDTIDYERMAEVVRGIDGAVRGLGRRR